MWHNFPFLTSTEIDNHLAERTLKDLENVKYQAEKKFDFYQNSHFYKEAEKHKAHLSVFKSIVAGCEQRITLLTEKGGNNE